MRRWRNVASFAIAIAAALVAMLAVQVYQPDLLPDGLRPKPRTQMVEVKTPAPPAPPSAQYVAVLQQDGSSPAFILTVDAATRNFTVRKVGAIAEPGKSFELWLISDKLPQPRSLGVIGGSDFTARPVLSSYDANTINGATYAVTVEQAGRIARRQAALDADLYRQADRDRAAGRSDACAGALARSSWRGSALGGNSPGHKKKTPVGSGRFQQSTWG